jgi:hypothetical protein
MPDTFVRTRCSNCQKVMSFEDFSAGGPRCISCSKGIVKRNRPPGFVPGPPPAVRSPRSEEEAYERMLDGLPDELIDELVAALEAEAARAPVASNPVREVLSEIGIGRSQRERVWAAWGFAAGFAGNVLIAKYAQMSANSPLSQFIGPMLIGGAVAGACCAAIGWGLAKLREPALA